jgi:tellurite resistance protein
MTAKNHSKTDAARLPEGSWHGHFAYAFEPGGLHPTQLELAIEGDVVAGGGADEDGVFTIKGTHDVATGAVRWQKKYDVPRSVPVAYVGQWNAETREFTGRWRLVNTPAHGRFKLRPGERSGASLDGEERVAQSFLERRAKEWQALCSVDLEAIRFDGERAVLEHLLRDPDYVAVMRTLQAERDELSSAFSATGPSSTRVRLRRPMAPGLFALLDRCVQVLGLKAPVDLYVLNDGAINACVVTTRDRRIIIDVTAGAINQLEASEMLYVLGHEIGHALLGHLETPRTEGENTTGITALRSFALQRYEEISADRVGLLCCDDVYTALRAEFILTTGIINRTALGDVRAFLDHARASVDSLDGTNAESNTGFDTHPYGELRALAIDLFARSKTFASLLAREGAEVSEAQMEREVARLMRLMNPSILEEGLKNSDVMEFALLAAYAVAEATSGVSAAERKLLRKLAKGHEELAAKVKAMSFEEQQLRLVDLSEVLVTTLAPPQRAALVEDLTVIARIDGRISKRERDTLNAISELLGLPVGGVDDALGPLEAGID